MKNLLNKGKAVLKAIEKVPVLGPVARYSNPAAELYFDVQMVGEAAKAGARARRKVQPVMDTMADEMRWETGGPVRAQAMRRARQARADVAARKRVGRPVANTDWEDVRKAETLRRNRNGR